MELSAESEVETIVKRRCQIENLKNIRGDVEEMISEQTAIIEQLKKVLTTAKEWVTSGRAASDNSDI
jgi:hypothetical protein